jgi:hypothetical protein
MRYEERYDLYHSPIIFRRIKSKKIRWERSGVHRVMAGEPKGEKPLRRPRCRWEDNTKTNLQEVGLDWSGSGEDQVAGPYECSNEPWVSSGVPRGWFGGVQTPQNSEILTNLSRTPNSVENTSQID